jgi:FkbM family methyltransferase
LKGFCKPIETIRTLIAKETNKGKVIQLRNGLKFSIRTKMDIWNAKEIILDRCYEKDFMKIQDGGNIIDIGASIGDFSILMAREYPHSKIIAFEPHPIAYEMAVLNIKTNGISNIALQNNAVGANAYKKECHFAATPEESTSLCEVRDESKSSSMQMVNFISFKRTVEDLQHVDLVKMDCEGGEYDILLNSSVELLQRIKCFSLEWHDGIVSNTHKDLEVHLKKCGFDVRIYYNPVHADIGLLFATR